MGWTGFIRTIFRSAVAALIALPAFAAPVTVTLGDAAVVLPEPTGLAALGNTNSGFYRFAAQGQASAGNHLVAAFIVPEAAKLADAGEVPEVQEWAIVFMIRGIMDRRVPTSDFPKFRDAMAAGIEKNLQDPASTDRVEKGLNDAIGTLLTEKGADPSAATFKLGEIKTLGIYAKEQTYFTYGAAARVKMTVLGKETATPMVMVLTAISVRDRLLMAAYYRKLSAREDVDAAKARALEWAQAITRANP